MMPEYGLGFWQCKLRYQTQEELLGVAREYKARRLPIDLIVIDFFHWPKQGDWRFDETYWPDPGKSLQCQRFLTNLKRCNDSRTQVFEHRAHGVYMANGRSTVRKL